MIHKQELKKEKENQETEEDLLKGFNFNNSFGVESHENVLDRLGHFLRRFGPQNLEERERHGDRLFLSPSMNFHSLSLYCYFVAFPFPLQLLVNNADGAVLLVTNRQRHE